MAISTESKMQFKEWICNFLQRHKRFWMCHRVLCQVPILKTWPRCHWYQKWSSLIKGQILFLKCHWTVNKICHRRQGLQESRQNHLFKIRHLEIWMLWNLRLDSQKLPVELSKSKWVQLDRIGFRIVVCQWLPTIKCIKIWRLMYLTSIIMADPRF